ncbi:Endonuclease/exonuclease/phosphatase [Aspergillus leporis]|jgi:endonuclease/exonuclease/phosphatase family metal-dependent hydrolase|uniref:Endonuclease/exonuclease/phosphatase n=1 Tax=Aspergillus leporis TaxID=41062 RepID=A0A5N5X6P7_9EURO|nr:Endonuclease/exonuclease/phosphatase [Aspergillus leporis]
MTTQNTKPIPIRLLTHNIRTIPWFTFPPEKPWNSRKNHIINQLDFNTAHNLEALICLQEVLHCQLTDILKGLNSASPAPTDDDGDSSEPETWKHIGCGRDGGEKGEYSPILYRPAVWALEWSTTRWLSETPDKPSRGWDAAYRRIVTYAVLRHRGDGRKVLSMNCHLDDRGRVSRFESAKLILEWMEEKEKEVDGCFLCGDFNTNSREQDDAYGVLTRGAMLHTRDCVDGERRYGNVNSWTGFNDTPIDDALLDYVLVGPLKGEHVPWKVRAYGILTNRFDDGIFASDHRAVAADVELVGWH